MDLVGKKAIITGGARGIGKAIVKKLLEEKIKVVVLDNDVKGIEEIEREMPDVLCVRCDITDYNEVKNIINNLVEKIKTIDILVNNAGIIYSAPLISITSSGIKLHDVKMWDKVISTDLSAIFYMTVNVVEKMIMKRTKGIIINISSVSAAGNKGQSAYSAAKAGVNAITASWAKELGAWGIRVAAIAPGFTNTESTHQALKKEILNDIVSKVPVKRLGIVDEIACGVVFVLKNGFINGKVLEIDGGLII